MTGIRWQLDLEELTASVMATVSEVFGSCAGEIDTSVELRKTGDWLCCWLQYFRLCGSQKGVKFGSGRGQWCQVSDVLFSALGLIEKLKYPVVASAFWVGL